MKVKYDKQKKKWIELEKGSEDGIYLDRMLKQRCDDIKKIIKKEYDAVILIDGKERIGKSTLGMTLGWYLSDEGIDENNIASDLDDAKIKIRDLPDKSTLIIDEGSLVFSSKDAMRKGQRELIKILDVVGQKNMIIIICLPSFFDLNKTIALRRSLFLIHCYKDKNWNRGRYVYFNEKKKERLYILGRKNFGSYDKPRTNKREKGTFPKFEPPFYKKYLEVKKKSLIAALNIEEKKNPEITERMIKAKLIRLITDNLPITSTKDIAKVLDLPLTTLYDLRRTAKTALEM